ncbi:MAG: hypothetical protein WC732_07495 [Candidatus Omnitrophota bacterium]
MKKPGRPYQDLFLISFIILFFELACIRWFGAKVIFLTYFTNIVLMACFLGMSVGCFAASRKKDYIQMVIPLAALSSVLATLVLLAYLKFSRLAVDVGGQLSGQFIYFGTEWRLPDPAAFAVPLWVINGVFFTLISLMFVGLGQVMGRAFAAIPDRVKAYTANVAGSLAGIVVFSVFSWLWIPAFVWFAVSLAVFFYFLKRKAPIQILAAAVCICAVSAGVFVHSRNSKEIWSPYYKILYGRDEGIISANNQWHQNMVAVAQEYGLLYALPHLLSRDAQVEPFKKILVIGSGSGNDVAAALKYADTDSRIDAVEIDPAILSIGRADHPDRPYSDPRVRAHLQDGRKFLHESPAGAYDLILYALVDSVVLHSGYSNLRLESFLFTKEAFEDIKKSLAPDGVLVLYNHYRQGWIVGRLVKMAAEALGSEPLVVSVPFMEKIDLSSYIPFYTMVIAGNGPDNPRLEQIRDMFGGQGSFWANRAPVKNESVRAFGPQPPFPDDDWVQVRPAEMETEGLNFLPSDAWPFLYLRDKTIPFKPTGQGALVVAFVSLAILFLFSPVKFTRPRWQMFFLGAGFMLLETKSVVHMALLFGSTWVVNSFIFFSILVMILLANLFVLRLQPRDLRPFYAGLLLSLLVNAFVPMSYFLALPDIIRPLFSCAVVFIPVFFAGVIFAAAFRESDHPDVDMGYNIAGVILGGLSENLSLMLGFNNLLFVAVLFYVFSALLRPRAS